MYTIIYDFGTSSVKTCLFEIDSEIKLVTNSRADYNLYISDNGAAEQDAEAAAVAQQEPEQDGLGVPGKSGRRAARH